jgi:uncharacterized membrane-anchored protein YjiN (DUF445 family)
VQAAKSLKVVAQVKLPASEWHEQFRIVDGLCLSIRVIHHLQSIERGETRGLEDIITEDTKQAVVDELVEILKKEFPSPQSNGVQDVATENLRIVADAFGAAPMTRPHHFIFGILHLMQELLDVYSSGKISKAVVDVALEVARTSTEKYLQLKAFELLAALDRKEKSPEWLKDKINRYFDSQHPTSRDRAEGQWYEMKERVLRMENHCERLRRLYKSQYASELALITALIIVNRSLIVDSRRL